MPFSDHLLAATSDLESFISTTYEETLHDYDLEKPNLSVEIYPFVCSCPKVSDLEDNLRTSSFL